MDCNQQSMISELSRNASMGYQKNEKQQKSLFGGSSELVTQASCKLDTYGIRSYLINVNAM